MPLSQINHSNFNFHRPTSLILNSKDNLSWLQHKFRDKTPNLTSNRNWPTVNLQKSANYYSNSSNRKSKASTLECDWVSKITNCNKGHKLKWSAMCFTTCLIKWDKSKRIRSTQKWASKSNTCCRPSSLITWWDPKCLISSKASWTYLKSLTYQLKTKRPLSKWDSVSS